MHHKLNTLGRQAQCTVTNLGGIVVARMQTIAGQVQLGIQPCAKDDGTVPPPHYADEILVSLGIVAVPPVEHIRNEIIKLGDPVIDTVSGYAGVAVARVDYLAGCLHFAVLSKSKDGKIADWVYFPIERLAVVPSESRLTASVSFTGGPSIAPTAAH